MTVTSYIAHAGAVSSRERSMRISNRSRALSRRPASMSEAEFAWLVMGWSSAVAGILAISLLLRSVG